jgi:hypothetical protein
VDNIIAVRVTLDSGVNRYFLTWGRLGSNDPWPGDIERAVLKASKSWAIRGIPAGAQVCDSLQEVSGERYFYENLVAMQYQMPPQTARKKFTAWAGAMTAAVLRGEQLYFLGLPKDEQDPPANPDARFGYVLECHDHGGHLVTGYHLDGLTAQDVQELLGDQDIDRLMCLAQPVSGPTLTAIVAGRDIVVDEAAHDYFLSPWADAGYRTPRGYFPPPPYLPADPGADDDGSGS